MSKDIEAKLQEMLDPAPRDDRSVNDRIGGERKYLTHVPKIVCADGFTMSVQASCYHYCTPRDSDGPYSAVEVGFPSAREEALMPYIDGGPDDPTGTVYGYVPLSVVAEIITSHGGFQI